MTNAEPGPGGRGGDGPHSAAGAVTPSHARLRAMARQIDRGGREEFDESQEVSICRTLWGLSAADRARVAAMTDAPGGPGRSG